MVRGLKNYYTISALWENSQVGEYLFEKGIPATITCLSTNEGKNYIKYFTELTEEDRLFIKIKFPDIRILEDKR